MTAYFVDSSALVKRYVPETGSAWIPLPLIEVIFLKQLPLFFCRLVAQTILIAYYYSICESHASLFHFRYLTRLTAVILEKCLYPFLS